jgi:hypothetical protein
MVAHRSRRRWVAASVLVVSLGAASAVALTVDDLDPLSKRAGLTMVEQVAPKPATHPVWRMDRIAGHPIDLTSPRADLLSDFDRRALRTHVERVADRVAPFDWRAEGVRFEIRCLVVDAEPCRPGVASFKDGATTITFVPSVAFLTDEALAVLVAHELAHAWQFSQSPARELGSALFDLNVDLPEGVPLEELEADCLAAVWGYVAPAGSGLAYWTCPTSAWFEVAADWRASPLTPAGRAAQPGEVPQTP